MAARILARRRARVTRPERTGPVPGVTGISSGCAARSGSEIGAGVGFHGGGGNRMRNGKPHPDPGLAVAHDPSPVRSPEPECGSSEEGLPTVHRPTLTYDPTLASTPEGNADAGPTRAPRRRRHPHPQPAGGPQRLELRGSCLARSRRGSRSGRAGDRARATVRALLVTGAGGRAFCAGADVKELMGRTPLEHRRGLRFGQALFERISDLRVPSIAVIDGFALGGGLELAMACTFRLATAAARMGLPEIKLGLVPGYGGTQRLPRLVGEANALDIVMTGRMVQGGRSARDGASQPCRRGRPRSRRPSRSRRSSPATRCRC